MTSLVQRRVQLFKRSAFARPFISDPIHKIGTVSHGQTHPSLKFDKVVFRSNHGHRIRSRKPELESSRWSRPNFIWRYSKRRPGRVEFFQRLRSLESCAKGEAGHKVLCLGRKPTFLRTAVRMMLVQNSDLSTLKKRILPPGAQISNNRGVQIPLGLNVLRKS